MIPDELILRFKNLNEAQQGLLWEQGDLLCDFIVEAFPDVRRSAARKKFFEDFAKAVDLSPAAIRLRYHTSRLFPPDKRAVDRTWFFHCLCGKAGKTPELAEQWLDKALAEGWTQTELEAAIKTSGDPKLVEFLAKTAPVTFVSATHDELHLKLEKPLETQPSASEGLYLTLARPVHTEPDETG